MLRIFTQSDHYPVFTIRKDVQSPKPNTHISKRSHSYKNIANFKRHINSINWSNIYNANNTALKFHYFMNNIINIFNQSFPIESIKINYQNRNPWINKKLKNEIKIRDKLYLLSKQIPTQANKDNYKKYKKKNYLIRERRKEIIIKNNLIYIKLTLKNHGTLLKT